MTPDANYSAICVCSETSVRNCPVHGNPAEGATTTVGAPQPGEAKPEFPPLPRYPDFTTPVGPLRSRLRELRYTSRHAIRLGGRYICFYDISDGVFEDIYQDVVRLETEVFRLAGLGERLEKAREIAKAVIRAEADMRVVVCDCGEPYADTDPHDILKEVLEAARTLSEAPPSMTEPGTR